MMYAENLESAFEIIDHMKGKHGEDYKQELLSASAVEGVKVGRAFMESMISAADKDAFVDKNGKVEFVEANIFMEAKSDPEFLSRLAILFKSVCPAVKDIVKYKKVKKFSDDRELERKIHNELANEKALDL